MKVSITGANGFVGRNLTHFLNSTFELSPMSVRYFLDQKIALQGDAMVHLAGKAHDLKNVSNPEAYYEANYELTKQVFDAFLNSEAKVFVFMSSVKAVADVVEGVLTEDVLANPQTHYGIAKHQAEQYILAKVLPEGKRVYILRPCMIHGPGNKGNLNLLYQLVAKGLPWPLGAFENRRSFLSIENLCFVIKELLQNKSISSGIYNVADDEFLSTNELIELFGDSLGKRNRILKIPTSLIKKIASVGDGLKLPLNSERLQKLTENYRVSNEKIKSAIGVERFPYSAQQGLEKTIKSFITK